MREQCLSGALARREPWGVWGGELFANGKVLAQKRRRGRPPKVARPEPVLEELVPVYVAPEAVAAAPERVTVPGAATTHDASPRTSPRTPRRAGRGDVPGICSPRILSEPRPAAVNPRRGRSVCVLCERAPPLVEHGSSPPPRTRRCETAPVRIVVALGGNALLRRGETVDLDRQRTRIADACAQLATIAAGNELVVAHGNGPQIGLLAREAAALVDGPVVPLDVLGAESQGMVGYQLAQELANVLPADRRGRHAADHRGGRGRRSRVRRSHQADRPGLRRRGGRRGASRPGLDGTSRQRR